MTSAADEKEEGKQPASPSRRRDNAMAPVEEAIEEGLEKLGLSEEEVDIEILDEGTKGLFGLGSRQARVLLTVKIASESTSEVPSQREDAPQPISEPEVTQPKLTEDSEPQKETDDQALQVAQDIVSDLLQKMKVGIWQSGHGGNFIQIRMLSSIRSSK